MTKEFRSLKSEFGNGLPLDDPFGHLSFEPWSVIRASSFPLGISRFRVQLRFWREIVVDHDAHSVSQLEDPGAHDLLAWFNSFRDRNEIAPRLSDAHELLPQDLRFLA